MGTATSGVLVFFGVIFFIGGAIFLVAGSIVGSIVGGVLGLMFIWAGAKHAKEYKEKLYKQLHDLGQKGY